MNAILILPIWLMLFASAPQLFETVHPVLNSRFIVACALGAGCLDARNIDYLSLHNHITLSDLLDSVFGLLAERIGLKGASPCAFADVAGGRMDALAADDMLFAPLVDFDSCVGHNNVAAKLAFCNCGGVDGAAGVIVPHLSLIDRTLPVCQCPIGTSAASFSHHMDSSFLVNEATNDKNVWDTPASDNIFHGDIVQYAFYRLA